MAGANWPSSKQAAGVLKFHTSTGALAVTNSESGDMRSAAMVNHSSLLPLEHS